jgi:hypothetical protein
VSLKPLRRLRQRAIKKFELQQARIDHRLYLLLLRADRSCGPALVADENGNASKEFVVVGLSLADLIAPIGGRVLRGPRRAFSPLGLWHDQRRIATRTPH